MNLIELVFEGGIVIGFLIIVYCKWKKQTIGSFFTEMVAFLKGEPRPEPAIEPSKDIINEQIWGRK